MKEVQEKLADLKRRLEKYIEPVFSVKEKMNFVQKLEKESGSPNFWADQKVAAKKMQKLEQLRNEIATFENFKKELAELSGLMEFITEKSPDFERDKSEMIKKVADLENEVSKMELQLLFNGKYDSHDAIVSIRSGAGGVDAQDWAEMILRMYLRWAEKKNFKSILLEETRGQEAGIKNATLEISGPFSYGNLKSEAGVHRLVRLSPYNADHLRQTSFALVEVFPVIEETKEIKIDSKDLRIDVYRSSGPGGQGVNTTDSAVRITHLPTGIVAACQNERSQMQNREQAMKILRSKLHQKHQEDFEKEKRSIQGEAVSAEWGSQIRSYVLHPYKLVKDHRTKFEATDAESVLNGNIDSFIESYLKDQKK